MFNFGDLAKGVGDLAKFGAKATYLHTVLTEVTEAKKLLNKYIKEYGKSKDTKKWSNQLHDFENQLSSTKYNDLSLSTMNNSKANEKVGKIQFATASIVNRINELSDHSL